MFTCDTCLRRALRSLANTSSSSSSPRLVLPSLKRTAPYPVTFSRSHVTLEALRKGHHRLSTYNALKNGKKKISVPKPRPSNSRSKFNTRQAEAVANNRLKRLEPEAREKYLKRAMWQESKYLVDPLKLAQEIVQKLRDNQLEEALELVRASEKANDGKGVENVVSWNHIIDWLMGKESPGEAWKVYNEMKKRGHKPDAHTYTIMLRGYRHNVKKPNAVQQAISVYDSISAANSAVTPTAIHTNALLSVCSRAHDIDALWKVAGKLPERGPGAPDHITFTTIFTGLNSEVQKRAIEQGAREGPGFDPQPIFDQVINDARKLWLDITARWRRGYLQVDESLVCAMGRLLMLSNDKQTQQDVLNLVHQTMDIAKMSDASGNELKVEAQETDEMELDEQRPSTIDAPARLPIRQDTSPRHLSTVNTSVYATPGTNVLSMLIETATALRELKLGKYYWELLTSKEGPYKVVPDHQNIMAYLRLLRVSRASRAILDLLREPRSQEVSHGLMVRGTFIIAMSTCLRDKKNPNVFETASRIMDLMQGSTDMKGPEDVESSGQKLRFSPKVLRMYLEVAIATTKGINGEPLRKTKNGDLDFERDPSKNHTLKALRRLGPETFNVKQMIKSYLIEIEQQAALRERTIRIKKLLDKRRITPYSTNENIGDLVELLRTMIGAIDKIILINEKLEDDGMGPLDAEVMNECWLQKRKLSAFVTKYANATVGPRNPSDFCVARRADERGQRVTPREAPVEVDDDNMDAEAEGVDLSEVDENKNLDDPSVPLSGPRREVLFAIKAAQDQRVKKSEERGLSRKQKIELIKKESIRAQYPASMLRKDETSKVRARESPGRWAVKGMGRREVRGGAGDRSRALLGSAERWSGSGDEDAIPERKLPVWKAKQLENKRWKAEKTGSRAVENEERKQQWKRFEGVRSDDVSEKGENEERMPAWKRREARDVQKQTYTGWGGGFEELVKEEGRNGSGSGFIDLRR